MGAICLHCFVSGRVQGVFFRRETLKRATSLGLTGWVKNLADGRVETLICGEKEAVIALQTWLRKGPPNANVLSVDSEECPFEKLMQFEIR